MQMRNFIRKQWGATTRMRLKILGTIHHKVEPSASAALPPRKHLGIFQWRRFQDPKPCYLGVASLWHLGRRAMWHLLIHSIAARVKLAQFIVPFVDLTMTTCYC